MVMEQEWFPLGIVASEQRDSCYSDGAKQSSLFNRNFVEFCHTDKRMMPNLPLALKAENFA